jgi:hypothetical protein
MDDDDKSRDLKKFKDEIEEQICQKRLTMLQSKNLERLGQVS